MIIVGTPNWSQDVDIAANDPINSYNNIAYSLHFYVAAQEGLSTNNIVSIISKSFIISVIFVLIRKKI